MKYWGLLGAKLSGATAFLWLCWILLSAAAPLPAAARRFGSPFGHDLAYTMRVLAFGLFALFVLALVALDQRYRCRVCLRRLRMPVATGSWENMVLHGPPKIEYICPFGHGTLRVPVVQISGLELARWEPHGDMWSELENSRELQD